MRERGHILQFIADPLRLLIKNSPYSQIIYMWKTYT